MWNRSRTLLLSGFENNRLMDVDFVRAIPDSALRWAPNDAVRDFAEQIEHTALDNVLFVAMGVTDGERPGFGDPDNYLNDKEALVEAVNAAYDWVMESLRRLPAEGLVMETELFSPGGCLAALVPLWQLSRTQRVHPKPTVRGGENGRQRLQGNRTRWSQ